MSWGGYIPGALLHDVEFTATLMRELDKVEGKKEDMQEVFRVVAKDGTPVDERNNGRKNLYRAHGDAQSAATQFNRIEVICKGEPVQLTDAPYTVQRGVITWE